MADLTEEQKREIVEALACYRDVPSIIAAFHSQYGVRMDRKQVGRYDPTRSYYAGGERWRAIFDARRKAYLEDIAAIPVANQGYRLNMLQRGVEVAEKAGNWPLVAKLLEQAAKEVGGALTNQQGIRIEDRGYRPTCRDMTLEERRAKVADLIRQTLEQRQAEIAALAPKVA